MYNQTPQNYVARAQERKKQTNNKHRGTEISGLDYVSY